MVYCQVGIFLFSFAVIFQKGGNAMISFSRFWLTLKLCDMSTYSLIKDYHISGSTINRLRHNKPISTATIDRLCEILRCDVDEIMEFTYNTK